MTESTGYIAGRYCIEASLGAGGMAVIHRVTDTLMGQKLALKRLRVSEQSCRDQRVRLFEREFLTLRQLAHPRIVRAYDYGVDEEGPFYTMELLDGGDLQNLSPLDWRKACSLMRDVCSALSLLHSRRLVYRDLSPRNVRCTTDGTAKLIDFGAMTPAGRSREWIGTLPFCAPEAINAQMLDARTDLYALGGTLYYTLVKRHAYPARDASQLYDLWRSRPTPPSALVPGIPEALDRLVLDLTHPDPAVRPASAAEVMERLSAIAGLGTNDQLLVSRAYLVSPSLVGRASCVARLRDMIARSVQGAGTSVIIQGPSGIGRSRLLDACVLEGKLAGACVLRADSSDAQDGNYGVARALFLQLLTALPELALEAAKPELPILGHVVPELLVSDPDVKLAAIPDPQQLSGRLQPALRRWLLEVASKRALLIAVDDVHLIDEPSAAWLSLLSGELPRHPVVLATTLASDAPVSSEHMVLKLLSETSTALALDALDREQTRELLGSVFGDVPNLALVAQRLHAITGGKPRDLMRLAQHLVDRNTAQYRGATWSLPEHIDSTDLPSCMTQALLSRIEALSPDARALARTMAHAPELRFTFDECLLLTDHGQAARLVRSLDELVSAEVLRRTGQYHAFEESGWTAGLKSGTSREEELSLHRRLARACELRNDGFRVARHLMLGGEEDRGVSVLVEYAAASEQQTTSNPAAYYALLQSLPQDWLACYELALRICEERKRSRKDLFHLRTRLSGLVTIMAAKSNCRQPVLALLQQLYEDSGLDIYATLEDVKEPRQRLRLALERAKKRHEALPESDRVLEPMAAIRHVGRVMIRAIGQMALSNDYTFWQRLPSLAPLAPLSPVLGLVELLAQGMGARLAGRAEQAIEIYHRVLERLAQPNLGLDPSLQVYTRLRVVGSIGIQEASMGLPLKEALQSELAAHPIYEMNALLLRMLNRLWQGDEQEAELLRREVELLRIQNITHQVFDSQQLMAELAVHALSENLTRVKRSIDSMQSMVELHTGWAAASHYARGEYQRICGDYGTALRELETALGLMQPACHVLWSNTCGALVKTLCALERYADAKHQALAYLEAAEQGGLGYSRNYIRMPLALALGNLGDHSEATRIADQVIESFTALGSTGLNLALAYEARANVALLSEDWGAFEQYNALCQAQLPRGSRHLLNAKYERPLRSASSGDLGSAADELSFLSRFASALESCKLGTERARFGLETLTRHSGATAGLLYLLEAQGLACVAHVGDVAPDARLDQLAEAYLAKECADREVTESLDDAALRTETAHLWTGSVGQRYVPVLLSHESERGIALTGLAVLVVEPNSPFNYPSRAAAELSRLAADAGDAAATYV